ncbi:MAG: hypothetical protein Q9174_005688, partial [Haloplaca sp. 1 TL-2023]
MALVLFDGVLGARGDERDEGKEHFDVAKHIIFDRGEGYGAEEICDNGQLSTRNSEVGIALPLALSTGTPTKDFLRVSNHVPPGGKTTWNDMVRWSVLGKDEELWDYPREPRIGDDDAEAREDQHATPEHIHLTTRRCFIGPIPEGWLKSHRKSWYREYINLNHYSSRSATFSAAPGVSKNKRITGLDGASSTTTFAPSFPQPKELENDEVDKNEDDEADGEDQSEDAHDDHDKQAEESLKKRDTPGEGGVPEADEPTLAPAPSPLPKKKRNLLRPNDKPGSSSKGRKDGSSFVTAPSEPSNAPKDPPRAKRRPTFVTAVEPPPPQPSEPKNGVSNTNSNQGSANDHSPVTADGANSRTSLLPHPNPRGQPSQADGNKGELDRDDSQKVDQNTASPAANHISSGMVRFNAHAGVNKRGGDDDAFKSRINRRRSWRYFRNGQAHPGQIVKTEKMLVRIDTAVQDLPKEYDENASIKIKSRTLEKWREYVVVCRESAENDDSEFSVQLYKTRVIPAMEDAQKRTVKRCAHEVPLLRRTTNVNLYSSLDKTLVLWMPWKGGSKIFLLRPRSSASSVEWYTFLRNALGWKRSRDLQINVPDLDVSLRILNPFDELEAARAAASRQSGDEAAILKTIEAEIAVANTIIQRCMTMLKGTKEWSVVLDAWMEHEKMGLAWKRYDRLEWVHGANEQRMYGSIAMQKSHDLELRPKKHYSTSVKPMDKPSMQEPAPVEGFLIRLTSQRGRVQRYGKMFFKRLYFFTHNHHLCYCRPAKALPPPPPRTSLGRTSNIPTPAEITEKTPLVYAVNPYPIKDGQIEWLAGSNTADVETADEEAYNEAERRTNSLFNAEGYIDICQIARARNVHRGSTPADAVVDQGSDVDFHEVVNDSRQDDGRTDEFDDERTFELVLNNDLIIRLQAYNKETKKEWMQRLRKLVEYWKLRTAEDMTLLKSVRQANLETLGIDEEMEAQLGQFGEKWEVARAVTSPQLFNICGISCCRAIT